MSIPRHNKAVTQSPLGKYDDNTSDRLKETQSKQSKAWMINKVVMDTENVQRTELTLVIVVLLSLLTF